jgi:hypothetical protein
MFPARCETIPGVRGALRLCGWILGCCLLVAAIGIGLFACSVFIDPDGSFSRSDSFTYLGLAAFVAAGGLGSIAATALLNSEPTSARKIFARATSPTGR